MASTGTSTGIRTKCTIRNPSPFPLRVSSFDTGGYLEINRVRYRGVKGPDVNYSTTRLGDLKIQVVSGTVKGKGDNCEGTGDRDCLDTDPYVKVHVNGKHSETDIKWNTDHPVWNQDMPFGTQPVGATVTLYLYDYDERGIFDDGPDWMGTTSFSVEKTGEIDTSVATTQGEGTIKLRLTFDLLGVPDLAPRGGDITSYSNGYGTGWELCWPHNTPPSPDDGVDCNCTTKKTTLGGDLHLLLVRRNF